MPGGSPGKERVGKGMKKQLAQQTPDSEAHNLRVFDRQPEGVLKLVVVTKVGQAADLFADSAQKLVDLKGGGMRQRG